MAERYWPFSAGAGASATEADWATMIRSFITTGVVRAQTDDALKGTLAQELQLFADSSGLQTKLRIGEAVVHGWHYQLDSVLTLPHDTAHATLARIDRVCLKLDTSARTIAAVVKTGTPGASPVAPALTQAGSIFEEQIGQVAIAAAATTLAAGTVTDERRYSRARGAAWAECRVNGAAGVDGSGNYNDIPDSANVARVQNTGTGLIVVHLRAGLRAVRAFSAHADGSLYVTQGGGTNTALALYLTFRDAAGAPTNPTNFWVAVFGDD
jgi:hypothetical protein